MNKLVYFWDFSGLACDCDSFLGHLGNTFFNFENYSAWHIILMVSWAFGD